MNVKYFTARFIGALFMASPAAASAGESIHLSFAEVQNIVSQKLAVAQSKNDATALQEAEDVVKGKICTNAVIYLQYGPEESFFLKLHILKVADGMKDKAFDPKRRTKAGTNGKVPWPPDNERPQALIGQPLWTPGQDPEDFKEANPKLYAIYKPLYDENINNTEKHKREGIIIRIRRDLLRDIRAEVKDTVLDNKKAQFHSRYVDLVKKYIEDAELQKDILSKE